MKKRHSSIIEQLSSPRSEIREEEYKIIKAFLCRHRIKSCTSKMKVVILFLVTLTVCVSCFAKYEDMTQEVDMLLKRLHTTDPDTPGKHRLSRNFIFEGLLTIDSNDFHAIYTHEIELEGIEKLTRISAAPASLARGGWNTIPPSTVLYVELSVKNGINMTSNNFEFFHDGEKRSAQFTARWRNSSEDAVFRLSGLNFNGYDVNFNADSVYSNVDQDKFEITLLCHNSWDQHLCNQLLVHYLNSWRFDIHTFIRETFDAEIQKISSK